MPPNGIEPPTPYQSAERADHCAAETKTKYKIIMKSLI